MAGLPSRQRVTLTTNPSRTQDENQRWAFRGFKTVTTTGPTGARVEDRFAYDSDWSGRKVETLTFASGSANPATISETTWRAFSAFGAISFDVYGSKVYTCETVVAGAATTLSEADCPARKQLQCRRR